MEQGLQQMLKYAVIIQAIQELTPSSPHGNRNQVWIVDTPSLPQLSSGKEKGY